MLQITLCALFLPFLHDALKRSMASCFEWADHGVWAALTVFVLGLQLLGPSSLSSGVGIQYSGAAFLAITLGYSRALLSMLIILCITQPLAHLGQSIWIDALLPIWLMLWLLVFTQRNLPVNPFVFLLGCGFIGLFLVYSIQLLVQALVLSFSQNPLSPEPFFSDQLVFSLLLAGGEATLEGMVVTILVVFVPRAVYMFDDKLYLSRPM